MKELELAMLAGEADFAVHCLKDIPAKLPEPFTLAALCKRDDPRDCLLSAKVTTPVHENILTELSGEIVIGTSSLRRQSLLLAHNASLIMKDIRGNLNTRLSKLQAGEYDYLVMAYAGVERLALTEYVQGFFPVDYFTPAIGQGTLTIECYQEAQDLIQRLQVLHDESSALCALAERTFGERLGASCQTPLGAYAYVDDNDQLYFQAFIADPLGQTLLRDQANLKINWQDEKSQQQVKQLALNVAERLLQAGGEEILRACV